jgi:hypothetical protein
MVHCPLGRGDYKTGFCLKRALQPFLMPAQKEVSAVTWRVGLGRNLDAEIMSETVDDQEYLRLTHTVAKFAKHQKVSGFGNQDVMDVPDCQA